MNRSQLKTLKDKRHLLSLLIAEAENSAERSRDYIAEFRSIGRDDRTHEEAICLRENRAIIRHARRWLLELDGKPTGKCIKCWSWKFDHFENGECP